MPFGSDGQQAGVVQGAADGQGIHVWRELTFVREGLGDGAVFGHLEDKQSTRPVSVLLLSPCSCIQNPIKSTWFDLLFF